MNNTIPKGVYVASLTPLNQDLSCNEEILAKHCLELIQRGCQGVVLFGTTGEGASFSSEEKKKALRQVISKGVDPQKIILGNGSASFPDTVELAKASLEHNCLACLISPPCFFKNVSEEGILFYYREIIRRAKSPYLRIIVYHIPQYTAVPISTKVMKKLCEEFPETIIGLKESEGNMALTKEMLREIPHLLLFVGKEKLLVEALEVGAWGSICGLANLYPELICQLYEKKSVPELDEIWKRRVNKPFIQTSKALLAKDNDPLWSLMRPPLT